MNLPPKISAALARPGARLALAVIVVLVLVVALIVWARTRDAEKMLAGFWVGEPAFLKEAGLREMYLYVSPRERGGWPGRWRRQGYLVMTGADGGLVSNQSVELSYGAAPARMASALRGHLGEGRYEIPALAVECEEDDVVPGRLRLGLDPTAGTLALYNDEKLFAFLTRDNETSLTANAEFAAAPPE